MEELNVDLAYGQALYEAAKDLDKVDQLLEESKEVRDILINEKEFFLIINDPTIEAKEKKNIIDNVFGGKISQELHNLFYVLVDKRRISHFIKIANQFENIVNEARGYGNGIIYTAVPLSEEQFLKIEEETSKLLREKIKLTQEIDTSLIGGMKILVKGKIIDASIKSKLSDMMGELVG